jgi:hypothetical protein
MECCPHDLYAELMRATHGRRKKTALVTVKDRPMAVVGLKQLSRLGWTPAAQWLVPGQPFPSLPDSGFQALASLNISLRLGMWRVSGGLPDDRRIREVEISPVYRLPLDGSQEGFWRGTHYFKTIRKARSRCEGLDVRVDDPGSVEWVVEGWAERWNHEPDGTADRILLADALQRTGRHHTVSVFDGEKRVAAASTYVHRNELVAGVLHWLPEYRDRMPGVYLIDRTFAFAEERGLAAFDLGGGHDYKQRWAPEDGTRTTFTMAPAWAWRVQKAASLLRHRLHVPDGRRGAAASPSNPGTRAA